MKYQVIDTLRQEADVKPTAPLMDRRARLERWADLLDAAAPRQLPSFYELEWLPRTQRGRSRTDGSALSVAFADPVLREAGLQSDRYGDALAFFGLQEHELHRLLCSCLNGRSVAADRLATEVRWLATRDTDMSAWVRWMPGVVTASVLGATLVMHLLA